LLNGPLQLRLRAFEGQDARAGAHRRLAFRFGQAFFGVLSHLEALRFVDDRKE
jgi:hypothetical protein